MPIEDLLRRLERRRVGRCQARRVVNVDGIYGPSPILPQSRLDLVVVVITGRTVLDLHELYVAHPQLYGDEQTVVKLKA